MKSVDLLQIAVVPDPLDELQHHLDLGPVVVGSRAAVAGRDHVRLGRLGEAADVAAKHFVAGHRVGVQPELQRDGQRIPDDPLLDHPAAPVQTVGDRPADELVAGSADKIRCELRKASSPRASQTTSSAWPIRSGSVGDPHQAALDHLVPGG